MITNLEDDSIDIKIVQYVIVLPLGFCFPFRFRGSTIPFIPLLEASFAWPLMPKGGEVSEQRYDCKNMDGERMKQRHARICQRER
jgi:hypothetical protein